jgi:tetratricopeptide (TPR) repeat protein
VGRERRILYSLLAARLLLQHFPDHLPTLEALSDLLLEQEQYAEALELLLRAWKANPLNRELRSKVATAHLLTARGCAMADRFEDAGREYQAALNLEDPEAAYSVLAPWAACEFRAGRADRGEELLRQASQRAPAAVAVAYLMLVEAIRLKLPRGYKPRFEAEFRAGLDEPAAPAAAAALLSLTHSLLRTGVAYHGQKTHAKKALSYVEKAPLKEFTESQMEQVCTALVELKSTLTARRFLDRARKRFKANPIFPYLSALTYLAGDLDRAPVYRLKPLLEDARRLAEALPPDARRDGLLQDIQERLDDLAAANPFGMGYMSDFFGSYFDDWEEDDDYED